MSLLTVNNSMHTLYYTQEQLERFWAYNDSTRSVRLIHILENDLPGTDDRYIVMVDCTDSQYTLLQML